MQQRQRGQRPSLPHLPHPTPWEGRRAPCGHARQASWGPKDLPWGQSSALKASTTPCLLSSPSRRAPWSQEDAGHRTQAQGQPRAQGRLPPAPHRPSLDPGVMLPAGGTAPFPPEDSTKAPPQHQNLLGCSRDPCQAGPRLPDDSLARQPACSPSINTPRATLLGDNSAVLQSIQLPAKPAPPHSKHPCYREGEPSPTTGPGAPGPSPCCPSHAIHSPQPCPPPISPPFALPHDALPSPQALLHHPPPKPHPPPW